MTEELRSLLVWTGAFLAFEMAAVFWPGCPWYTLSRTVRQGEAWWAPITLFVLVFAAVLLAHFSPGLHWSWRWVLSVAFAGLLIVVSHALELALNYGEKEMTGNLGQWSALVGILLPLLVAVVEQQHYPSWLRSLIGDLACGFAAVVTAYLQGNLDFHNWYSSAVVIFALAKTSYLAVWKPSTVAPRIEAATSNPLTPAPPPPAAP